MHGGGRAGEAQVQLLAIPGTRAQRQGLRRPSLQLRERTTYPGTGAPGGDYHSALAGVDFLGLADGTSGRLRYIATSLSDRWEDATLYRRELTYTVDYSTTIAVDLPRMAVGALNATLGADPIPETLLN